MKKQQFNFKDLKGALTRDEMREVKGGDGVQCGGTCPSGSTQTSCTIWCLGIPGISWCLADSSGRTYCWCSEGQPQPPNYNTCYHP